MHMAATCEVYTYMQGFAIGRATYVNTCAASRLATMQLSTLVTTVDKNLCLYYKMG